MGSFAVKAGVFVALVAATTGLLLVAAPVLLLGGYSLVVMAATALVGTAYLGVALACRWRKP